MANTVACVFESFYFHHPRRLSLLLTFAGRESSSFGLDPGIRRHHARKFKHLLQKQAFFGRGVNAISAWLPEAASGEQEKSTEGPI